MRSKRKLLLTAAFTALLGVGVFAGVTTVKETSSPIEVKAESWSQDPTIYFCPSDNWAKDNASFKMNYYDKDTYKGVVTMTLEGTGSAKGLFNGRKVFKGVVSDGTYVSRIQILRFKNDLSEQWNYSGTIYLTNDNASPVLMTNADLSNWNDWTTDTSGVWFNALQDYSVYKTSDYSPSSSTGRVFFNNSGTHWADNSTYKGCAVYAWGGDASPKKWTTGSAVYSATVYHLTWFNDDNGMAYGYADIPLNATGYKFVRTTIADEYTTGLGYFSDTSFIIDSFAYVRFGKASGNAISSGGAKSDVAGANLMKKVIEAYDTCSSSVLNGYGAYDSLNTNFYSHATAAAKSATQKSLNGSTTTIQNHFLGMSARKAVGGSGRISILNGALNNTSTTITIVAISAACLAAVGGYFLFRKKKEN